jgi:Tfp pilus assembly protein PilO
VPVYDKRTPRIAELGYWQNYVIEKIQQSGAKLRQLKPKGNYRKGVFLMVGLEVVVEGEYEKLVDFIDRLERGDRIVRIESFTLDKKRDLPLMQLVVNGLVKVPAGGKKAKKSHA